jgi:prolyl 4-hydroxylase
MDQHERDRLFCSYTSSSSAYLKLQPVKQEVISLHPQIVIYHDIISDHEIELIKRLAQPKARSIILSAV